MKNERQLQEYVKKQAKINGIGFYKMQCVGRTGFPDVMLAFKGRAVFIELKSPADTGRLSPRQTIMINELITKGQEVYVIKNKEAVDAIITNLTEREPKPVHRPTVRDQCDSGNRGYGIWQNGVYLIGGV